MSRDSIYLQMAEEFLEVIDAEMVFIFQTFDDVEATNDDGKKVKRKDSRLTRVIHGHFDEVKDQLIELNQSGAGIFVTVNRTDGSGKRAEKNITSIRGFFVDKDDGDIVDPPLRPTILVKPKRGHHAYYLLKEECHPGEFKAVQKGLIKLFGADPAVSNPASVLRVPGFLHQKDPSEPVLVQLLDDWIPYSLDEIRAILPNGSEKKKPVQTVSTSQSFESFRSWASQQSILEGDNNPNGGRNATVVKIVREGLGQDHARDAIWSVVEAYCERSGFNEKEARDLFDRHLEQHEESPFQAYQSSRPSPFSMERNGVFYKDDENDEKIWICSELEIVASTRNQVGEEWGTLVRLVDPDGTEKEWAIPNRLLGGDGANVRAELLSLGLKISPSKKAYGLLNLYLQLARTDRKALCVPRVGWHGSRFVLPDETIGLSESDQLVVLQGICAFDNKYRCQGTLDEWRENIGALCVGNSRVVLAASMAFAAPLLHPTGSESAGLQITGPTSTGKSTASKVAGSICGGGGANGYINRWRATSNGLEATAEAHCDTLLILDELGQVEPEEAGAAAYMLANGSGKMRANEFGSARKSKEWRTLFLSTGEICLSEHMREAGKTTRAGQETRMADVPADAGGGLGLFENIHGHSSANKFADHLGRQTQKYYGAPLREYLKRLTADLDANIKRFERMKEEIFAKIVRDDFCGQVQRVARRFAFIGAAGELARMLGIVPWQKGEASRAAVKCFRAWMISRGGPKDSEALAAIHQVKVFLEQYGDSRFVDLNHEGAEGTSKRVNNRAGYVRKTEDDEIEWLVFPQVFKREVCKGLDSTYVAKVLRREKHLISPNEKCATYPVRIHGLGQVRVYRIKSTILGGASLSNDDVSGEPSVADRQGSDFRRENANGADTTH